MPTGDEKHVAKAYAVSLAATLVTEDFCSAQTGIVTGPDRPVANEWLGRSSRNERKYEFRSHPRKVKHVVALFHPCRKNGKRAHSALPRPTITSSFPADQSRRDAAGC